MATCIEVVEGEFGQDARGGTDPRYTLITHYYDSALSHGVSPIVTHSLSYSDMFDHHDAWTALSN